MQDLVLFMARRVAGDEAESLAREAGEWILHRLGPDYEWPGNYRELEQCIRNLLIRKDYRPVSWGRKDSSGGLFEPAYGGRLTASELLTRYCTLIYARTGSYEETARRLDLDRRTVKSKVDAALLERVRREAR
jgi:transcriptional regulator of acetoin/glycerol metabolism